MVSIIQGNREGCYICGRIPTECHHIYGGVANRPLSDKYGLTVDLCAYHHRDSKGGVHFNPILDSQLKARAREKFVEFYNLDFEEIFRRGVE